MELSKTAQARAVSAIEQVRAAHVGRGGLNETEDKAKAQRKGVSSCIFKLARFASEQCKTVAQARLLFRDLCRHAEAEYKRTYKVPNVYKDLPAWTIFKAHINGAMKLGLDPLDFRTEHAMRTAVEGKQGKGRATVRMAPALRPAYAELTAVVGRLRGTKLEQAQVILAKAASDLAALASKIGRRGPRQVTAPGRGKAPAQPSAVSVH